MFNSSGKLIQDIDSRGFTLTYSYTTAGKLSQIADASNQAIRVNYAASGRIDSVIAPEPSGNAQRKAQYVYDAGGRLIRVDIQALQTNDTYVTSRDTKYGLQCRQPAYWHHWPDGVKSLTAAIDLTGRQDTSQDQLGNMADLSFTVDTITATGRRKLSIWNDRSEQCDGPRTGGDQVLCIGFDQQPTFRLDGKNNQDG